MDSIPLVPEPRVRFRAIICIVLLLLPWIGGHSWGATIAFSLTMAVLFGSYPRSQINAKCLRTQWYACFVPVYLYDIRTRDVIRIEIGMDDRWEGDGSMGSLPMKIVWLFYGGWFWDRAMPWLGGDYKLILRTFSDEKIQVWQGNSKQQFDENLSILEETLHLPVERG